MFEQRREKRVALQFYLKVSEQETEKHLGYLVDISYEGLQMLTEKKIPSGSDIYCQINLPHPIHGENVLSVKARSCWTTRDVDPLYYASGHQIYAIDPPRERIISTLIDNFANNRLA